MERLTTKKGNIDGDDTFCRKLKIYFFQTIPLNTHTYIYMGQHANNYSNSVVFSYTFHVGKSSSTLIYRV